MESHDNPGLEQARLATLWSSKLLESPPDERVDRLTRLVKQFFAVPIAAVTLVDQDRVLFRSCMGLSEREGSRWGSFCDHALGSDGLYIVNDARRNPAMADSPLVTGEAGIRFYAGHPLRAANGHIVGFLCVLDTRPRDFTPEEASALADFAALVENELFVNALGRQLALNVQELDRERRFGRMLLDHAGEGIFGLDQEGNTTFVNPAAAAMLGYRSDELIGRNQHGLVHAKHADGECYAVANCPIYQTLLTGEVREVTDEVFWHKDGTSLPVHYIATPFKEGESVSGTVVIFRDVTRQLEAAALAREELGRLHQLLATMRDAAQVQLDLRAVIQLILENAIEITQASGAVLAVQDGQEMIYRFGAGIAAPYLDFRLPVDASLPGLCVRTGETQLANDTESDPRVARDTCRRLGARSLLMVPLNAPGYPNAALGVMSDRPNAFSPLDMQALALMGEFVGSAVAQANTNQDKQQLLERLAAMNAELLGADHYKDEFLSVISHELRTPLNFIMGFASILADGAAGVVTPIQQHHVESILNGADRMLALVNDLLDFSKLQAGKFSLDLVPSALNVLVEEAVAALAPLAAKAGVKLELDLEPDLHAVLDPQRLTQILTNLVSNGIKFAPHGTVRVAMACNGDDVEFRIGDNGIGIAAEDLPKLFVRFQQLDMSKTRSVGGTGLGLAISKGLVDAHHGTIGVESTTLEGSTFWFKLPFEDFGLSEGKAQKSSVAVS
jgi:PAS domain S-box-containing protein